MKKNCVKNRGTLIKSGQLDTLGNLYDFSYNSERFEPR